MKYYLCYECLNTIKEIDLFIDSDNKSYHVSCLTSLIEVVK